MFSFTTMTPEHPRWGELIARLEKVERCARSTANARAIMESMGGIDITASLEALRRLGGVCDCSILYDVADSHLATA